MSDQPSSTVQTEEEPCPVCDDTGYEPGLGPYAFCAVCKHGLAVAMDLRERERQSEGNTR